VTLSDDRVAGDSLSTNYTSASFADKNSGTAKPVSVSGISISGADSANYTFNTTATAAANITAAPLTITAITNTKTHNGDTSAAAIPVVSGLLGTDTATGLTETYDTPDIGTGKTLSVATYTINDGNGGSNYSVSTVVDTTGVIQLKSSGGHISSSNSGNSRGQVLGAQSFHFTLTLKKGSKGDEVTELQKFLNAAGYNCGTPDGKFGQKTKLALIKFQIANGLKGDGVTGPLTRAVLNK
jgi:hypothetical protein